MLFHTHALCSPSSKASLNPLTSKVLLILRVQLWSHLPLEAIAEYLHFSFANIVSPTQVRSRSPLQGFEYPWP